MPTHEDERSSLSYFSFKTNRRTWHNRTYKKINGFPCCAWYVDIPPQFQLANLRPHVVWNRVYTTTGRSWRPEVKFKNRDKAAEPDTIENNAQTRLKVRYFKSCTRVYRKCNSTSYALEPDYNDIALRGTLSITSDVLCY